MHRKLIPALLPGEGREPGEQAAVRAAAHERVDAEAAACRVDREQHVYDGEKNVIPRWRPHVVRFPRDTGSRAENPLEGKIWAPSRCWSTSAASPPDLSHPTHCRCGEEWERPGRLALSDFVLSYPSSAVAP